jgi:hypothetical protein
MNTLKNCIPDFQMLLTNEGWQGVDSITINSKLMTICNGKINYENPKIFSIFPYKGIITEHTIVEGSSLEFSGDEWSRFYAKSYKDQFQTYTKTLLSTSENVLWEGNLCSIQFGQEVLLPISNGVNYVLIKL